MSAHLPPDAIEPAVPLIETGMATDASSREFPADETNAKPGPADSGRRARWVFLLIPIVLGTIAWFAAGRPDFSSQRREESTLSDAADLPTPTAATAGDPVEPLLRRLDAQESRIAALEQAAAAPAKDGALNARAEQALQQADRTMETLRSEVASLQAKLGQLQAQAERQGVPLRQLQLWVVLDQLDSAIQDGGSTLPLVVQLREGWIDSGREELDALRQLAEAAESRIPTQESLAEDFHQLATDVGAGYLRHQAGWWTRLKALLRSNIRITRLDREGESAPSGSADPLVAMEQVESALADERLGDAIEITESLPGRTAFAGWLENAHRRLAAEQAVDLLGRALLDSMRAQPLRDPAGVAPSSRAGKAETFEEGAEPDEGFDTEGTPPAAAGATGE